MKVNLYFVSTPYHVLSGLLDMYLRNEKCNFICISNFNDDYTFFKQIKERLSNFTLVQEVIIIKPRAKMFRFLGYPRVQKYIQRKFQIGFVGFFAWNIQKLYTNNNFFFQANKNKVPIYFFEDGSNVYLSKNNKNGLLFKVLCWCLRISSTRLAVKNVERVYVTYPEKFPSFFGEKLIRRSIVETLQSAPESVKNKIVALFLGKEESERFSKIKGLKNVNILFTQPFYRDGYISSDAQSSLYEKLIERYSADDSVLIVKKHPRDELDYAVNKHCMLVSGKLPSELLNIYEINFNRSIGINSSAVKSVQARSYINEDLL